MSDDIGTAADSGLGRYAPDPSGAPLVQVELLRLPVRVLSASQEHHDGLMREFRLLALAGDVGRSDAPARLVELVGILGQQYASARSRREAEMDELLAGDVLSVDWDDEVPATAAEAALGLRQLIDEADRYCEQALLATLPRHPTVRRFAHWYLGEYVDQIAGRPATPWDGPLHVEG